MEMLEKRISYLRGLTDGLELDASSREGRILSETVQLLDDVYGEIRALKARLDETESYAEAIDEDLNDLELLLYDETDDLYEDVDDRELDQDVAIYYDLDDSEDSYVYDQQGKKQNEFDTSYEFECPSCQEVIFFHEGVDKEGYHHYVIEPYWDDREAINPS